MRAILRITVAVLLLIPSMTQAQQMEAGESGHIKKTVAVVSTTGESVSKDIRIGISNGLQEGVFNSGEYKLVARGVAFEKALGELKFQQSGAVSDSQLTEFGHAAGADYVCYATVSKYTEMEYRISYKMIDVALGEIVNMGKETVKDGVSGLLDATDNIAQKLFGSGSVSVRGKATAGFSDGSKNNGSIYNPDGIELIYVAGVGSGIMATKGFYIGKYEITQAQWQAIMGSNPSEKQDPFHPVTNVSWNDAKQFLAKLNEKTGRSYRLPTEAEWVYAANGGSNGDTYEYAGSNSIDEVAWYGNNSGGSTRKVGTKKPNSAGIYDMSGNVWEWCEDCYDSSCSGRVIRGGGWDNFATGCRVSIRTGSPGGPGSSLGFRVALP